VTIALTDDSMVHLTNITPVLLLTLICPLKNLCRLLILYNCDWSCVYSATTADVDSLNTAVHSAMDQVTPLALAESRGWGCPAP
jgi:hypothetical protein